MPGSGRHGRVGYAVLGVSSEWGVECAKNRKEGKTVEQILGWGTAGGLGILLAGLGVFFWGLQFLKKEHWQGKGWTKKE